MKKFKSANEAKVQKNNSMKFESLKEFELGNSLELNKIIGGEFVGERKYNNRIG